jgi:L-ribulose-5-phosphate 3-epimerase
MTLAFGYNTNGLAHHTLEQILELCIRYGYEGLALTLDTHHLNPFTSTPQDIQKIRQILQKNKLRLVIETGARYLLDTEHKHYPTLLHDSPGFEKRLDFLLRCLEMAHELEAEALSFWSGVLPPLISPETARTRLQKGLSVLLEKARFYGIPLALEPEPGMFIESFEHAERLLHTFSDVFFGLTLDLGHLQCTEEPPLASYIFKAQPYLKNIHIEDIRNRVHEHLPFGEGTLDFPSLFKALHQIEYQGLLNVELSRNSHNGPEQMRRSFAFLQPFRSPSLSP